MAPQTTAPQTTAPEVAAPPLETRFPFELPYGYVDPEGELHRRGVMRLATAYDEIAPLRDPRVRANPGYLVLILLSRVVVELGGPRQLNPKMMEQLFAADLAYLQDLYQRINEHGHGNLLVTCPHCEKELEVEAPDPGEAWAAPRGESARR